MSFGLIIAGGSALIGAAASRSAAKKSAATANQVAANAQEDAFYAREQMRLASEAMDKLTPPNLAAMVQPYRLAVVQGEMTPEDAVFRMLEDSRVAGIQVSPELIQAQANALGKMRQIADQGGLTAIDRAQLLDIQTEQATRSRGEQEAIQQDLARRGQAGSGAEIAGRLLSQQGAATRSAAGGASVAAEAQRRALEAIQSSGTMATGMRTQDFGEQTQRAAAADAVAKFNNSFQNATAAANVDGRNAAQQRNLQEQQRISEFNVGQSEKEAAARIAASQSDWQNVFNKATNVGNLATGAAAQASDSSIANNNLARDLNQQSAAQRANMLQQGTDAAGSLVKLWKK